MREESGLAVRSPLVDSHSESEKKIMTLSEWLHCVSGYLSYCIIAQPIGTDQAPVPARSTRSSVVCAGTVCAHHAISSAKTLLFRSRVGFWINTARTSDPRISAAFSVSHASSRPYLMPTQSVPSLVLQSFRNYSTLSNFLWRKQAVSTIYSM